MTLPRSSADVRQAARDARKQPTQSERILWKALRDRQLSGRKFRRQQPIGPFIVDFYCHEEGLAVEVDGVIHDRQKEADKQRQLALGSLGLRFIRIPAETVEADVESALELISEAFSLPSPAHGRGAGGEGP